MALLISDDVKSMFDSSFSNMTQFNCFEIHYVDEHRSLCMDARQYSTVQNSTVQYCTAPSMDAWQLAWHNVQIRAELWEHQTTDTTKMECLKHSDQQQWDARFHVSAGQDAAATHTGCLQRHRWWAEINWIKTIQIILVSYQFVTKCIWCLMYKWITSFFSWHSRHVEIVYLWSQFKHYCNGRSME